jgi:hypothetical protein
MITLIVVIVIVVLLALVLWVAFNGRVKKRNRTQEAFSEIDVELKRRHDLVRVSVLNRGAAGAVPAPGQPGRRGPLGDSGYFP